MNEAAPSRAALETDELARVSRAVDRRRAPDDEMFAGVEEHYLSVGISALRCIRLALLAAGAGTPRRILDLPCGHGRVLRALRAAWPEAELTACDISRSGVDFCARTFGARPVYSAPDPRSVPLPDAYFDLIWAGSLLTHLDREHWSLFLERFHAWTAPGGLLVFTTHGRYAAYRMGAGIAYGLEPRELKGILDDYVRHGFGYRDYPGRKGYGVSLSTPAFVASLVRDREDARIAFCGERLWDEHQDVVAFQRMA